MFQRSQHQLLRCAHATYVRLRSKKLSRKIRKLSASHVDREHPSSNGHTSDRVLSGVCSLLSCKVVSRTLRHSDRSGGSCTCLFALSVSLARNLAQCLCIGN